MKITKTEKYVLAAIIVIAVFLAISVRSLVGNVNNLIEKKEKEDKQAYAAWVKVTDNPKKLSYDEWKALSKKGLVPLESKSETE